MADESPRAPTQYRALVRPIDALWTPPPGTLMYALLDWTVDGRTQIEGKKRAARRLTDDSIYRPLIVGQGLELFLTSARSFKPQTVKTEPQPAKVVIR